MQKRVKDHYFAHSNSVITLRSEKQLDSNKIDNAMLKFEQYERRVESQAKVESYDLGSKNLSR